MQNDTCSRSGTDGERALDLGAWPWRTDLVYNPWTVHDGWFPSSSCLWWCVKRCCKLKTQVKQKRFLHNGKGLQKGQNRYKPIAYISSILIYLFAIFLQLQLAAITDSFQTHVGLFSFFWPPANFQKWFRAIQKQSFLHHAFIHSDSAHTRPHHNDPAPAANL